jgi:hypothetical protein
MEPAPKRTVSTNALPKKSPLTTFEFNRVIPGTLMDKFNGSFFGVTLSPIAKTSSSAIKISLS